MTEPQTIILIGTSHSYQTQACKTEDAQAFQWFLLQKCRQSGIKRLAEELNKEALQKDRNALEETKIRLVKESKNPEGPIREDLKWIKKALERWEGKSVAQKVAAELGLKEPLFCDPDSEQRKLLGIEDEKLIELEWDFERRISADEAKRRIRESRTKREHYWLKQLQKNVSESECPVLFICGAEHVNTFSKLLRESGFNVKCICDDWKSLIPAESE